MRGTCRRCDTYTTIYTIEVGFQSVADASTKVLICRDCFETVDPDNLLDQPAPE